MRWVRVLAYAFCGAAFFEQADSTVGLTCWQPRLGLSPFNSFVAAIFCALSFIAIALFDSVCGVLTVTGTSIPLPFFVHPCRGQTLPTISDGGG